MTIINRWQEYHALDELQQLGQSFQSTGEVFSAPQGSVRRAEPRTDPSHDEEARLAGSGADREMPNLFELEATMYGSQLLEEEVDWHVAKHKRQLVSATKTIQEVSAKKIERQAMAAAEKAGAEVTSRLNQRAEELKLREQQLEQQHLNAFQQIEEFKQQQAAMLDYERMEMQQMLEDERAAMQQERQDMMNDLKRLRQMGDAELKREWARVKLTSDVATVYLEQTAAAVAAQASAENARAAAEAQMNLALEMQSKCDASTERMAQLQDKVHQLHAEIERLHGIAEEAERRTALAERVLDSQGVLLQSAESSVKQPDSIQSEEQVDEKLVTSDPKEQQKQTGAQPQFVDPDEEAQVERSLRDSLERDVRALEVELAECDEASGPSSIQLPDTSPGRLTEKAHMDVHTIETGSEEVYDGVTSISESSQPTNAESNGTSSPEPEEDPIVASQRLAAQMPSSRNSGIEVASTTSRTEPEEPEPDMETGSKLLEEPVAVLERLDSEQEKGDPRDQQPAVLLRDDDTQSAQTPSSLHAHGATEQVSQEEDTFATMRAIEAAFAGPPSAAMQTDYGELFAEGIPPELEPHVGSLNSEGA